MPTIKDVAERAGVSVTTVSRVLNNRGYISEATRKKVYQAMEELDYQPNEVARSLFRKKSNIIGLIVPTVAHPFFAELTAYLETYAYSRGYKVLICNSQLDASKEQEYIWMLRRNQVDGIIMASHTLEVEEYKKLDLPVVAFDRFISKRIPYVTSDNYQGGRLAVELLLERGCKQIAHMCGSLHLDMLANQRHRAFMDVAEERKVPYFTVETDINVFEVEKYEELLSDLLTEHPDIDGLFLNSDIMAIAAMKVCRKLGKRIPQDIKIIGYDDVSIASLVSPQITSIRQPLAEMSELSVRLIEALLEGKPVEVENCLPVQLMERETT
ncbi:MAG TPA: LacI family transcriptional regulator [Firmicutes bacterium]|nr:LacI family transcriptional regulator [Bacillota bacterium]